MSNIRLLAAQTSAVTRGSEGQYVSARGLRDGALVSADWVQALIMEGKGYIVNNGVLTTPITFNATIAAAEQDLFLHVPDNTCVIPIYISVQFEDTGTAQVLDVLAIASSTGDSAVTGTALTKYNLRTDAPATSACTATGVVTSNGSTTYAGNFYEFWRPYAGFGEDAFNGSTGFVNSAIQGAEWSITKSAVMPIVADGGSISVYAAAQAGTGFITLAWIELPSSYIQ